MTDLSGSPSSAEILLSNSWKKIVLELCNILHEITPYLLPYGIAKAVGLAHVYIFVFYYRIIWPMVWLSNSTGSKRAFEFSVRIFTFPGSY